MSLRPNQLRIAHDFVKYSALNAIGGLTYCLQISERTSGLKSSSALAMNVCVIVAAIIFSGKLLAAHG
jgi:UDP-3-O-acyl-N-acetylglucosamine deacetylase